MLAASMHTLDQLEASNRKQTASLLVVGAACGFLGFAFAAAVGIATHLNPQFDKERTMLFEWHGSRGYFPSSVSEMVNDPSSAAGKSFFAFEFIGAISIFLSWFPFHLKNVYMGDDETIRCTRKRLSWSMFRQFCSPTGMMLVAVVTTVDFAKARGIDYVPIVVNGIGRAMMYVGHALCEAKSLGMLCFEQPRQLRDMSPKERFTRRSLLYWLLLDLLLWSVVWNLLVAPDELLQGLQLLDTAEMCQNVTRADKGSHRRSCREKWAHTVAGVVLQDTSSGHFRSLKRFAYFFEVSAGFAIFWGYFGIWYWCDERHVDLDEQLTRASLFSRHHGDFPAPPRGSMGSGRNSARGSARSGVGRPLIDDGPPLDTIEMVEPKTTRTEATNASGDD